MPVTIALTSAILLSVVSFKQRALWCWMAVSCCVVLAMSIWLKGHVEGGNRWNEDEIFFVYGWRLFLMAMLALPRSSTNSMRVPTSARYPQFYSQIWLNVLTLLIVFVANGLFWMVLLLWSEMFKLVGIPFLTRYSLRPTGLVM